MDIKKINQKVNEVKNTFSWYSALIDKKEYINDINELPLMDAKMLEKYYYSNPMEGEFSVYHTSGTSSKIRKKIYYSEKDDEQYVRLKSKVYHNFIKDSGIKKSLSDMGTGHASNTARKVFEGLGLESEEISFQLPIDQHVEKLKTFKPDLLYTMPSILDGIINESDNPKEYGIRKIILVGEIASKEWIKKVAKIFRIEEKDIMDTYGCIELGTMAYYSNKYHRYIIMDDMVAEGISSKTLDESYDALGENECVLVLTSFVREAFPAIRYVTYDVVRDLKIINVNGVEKYSFESIVKRIGPEIKHGEKISIYDIENVVYRHLDDAIIRIGVNNNRLRVLIKSNSLNEDLLHTIKEEIQNEISEIGVMIKNNMLDEIEVIHVSNEEELRSKSVKNKKIYYED